MIPKKVLVGAAIVLSVFALIMITFDSGKEVLPNDFTIHMWESGISSGGQGGNTNTTITFENGIAKNGENLLEISLGREIGLLSCNYYLDSSTQTWKQTTPLTDCPQNITMPNKKELEEKIASKEIIVPGDTSCRYVTCYELIE